MMKSILMTLFTVMFLITAFTYAFGQSNMLACTQMDGTTMYTNKNIMGCVPVAGPALSVVPSYSSGTLEHTKSLNAPVVTPSKAPEPSQQSDVVAKTCAMYKEWVTINERTKGGFEYNTVDDTKTRLYLTKIFGSGFSPSMCKE